MERYQLAEYISDTLTHNCGNINKSESQSWGNNVSETVIQLNTFLNEKGYLYLIRYLRSLDEDMLIRIGELIDRLHINPNFKDSTQCCTDCELVLSVLVDLTKRMPGSQSLDYVYPPRR
jgi:hypothetical protein